MQLLLAYSLPRNLTVKALISVVTTYYIRVSDAAVVSLFISAETETSFNCRRCLAMDVRVDSCNQAFRWHATIYTQTPPPNHKQQNCIVFWCKCHIFCPAPKEIRAHVSCSACLLLPSVCTHVAAYIPCTTCLVPNLNVRNVVQTVGTTAVSLVGFGFTGLSGTGI
jgi:hypothetical protein